MSIIKIIQRNPVDVLREKREAAVLTVREFILALVRDEVLTPDEAVGASKGNWPTPMAGFLEQLTPEQSADAQIEWAAAGTIERTHVFVLTLASWMNMKDSEVDQLFGI